MQRRKKYELKLGMRCTSCKHEYDFVVERGKELIHDKTKCPKCTSFGLPKKGGAA